MPGEATFIREQLIGMQFLITYTLLASCRTSCPHTCPEIRLSSREKFGQSIILSEPSTPQKR